MEKLIEPVVSFLEIMVLGGIAILFFGYAIALVHPVRVALLTYFSRVYELVFPPSHQDGDHSFTYPLKVGIVLGIAYYAGVLGNTAAYWLLHPAHIEIISHVTRNQQGVPIVDEPGWRFLWLPFFRHGKDHQQHEAAHADSLYREMNWRNINLAAASDVLDLVNKYIRLLRGTVLFALCFGLVAFLKVGVGAVIRWVIGSKGRFSKYGDWLYLNMVDDGRHWLAEARKERPNPTRDLTLLHGPGNSPNDVEQMRQITWDKMIWPNLIVMVLAGIIYGLAMFSWRTAELEYHAMVLAGEATAVDQEAKKSKSDPNKTEPTSPTSPPKTLSSQPAPSPANPGPP